MRRKIGMHTIEIGQLRKFHDDRGGKCFLVVRPGLPNQPMTHGAWEVLIEDRLVYLGVNYIVQASYVIETGRSDQV